MNDDTRRRLIAAAIEVQHNAYAPYSGFAVGAALLGTDDRVFVGCNVENTALGSTLCAERAAVATGVSAGCRDFEALALATRGGGAPCGACLQVLAEFAPQIIVLLVDTEQPDQVRETSLQQLLPVPFERS